MRLTTGSTVTLNAVPGVWGFFRAREAAAVGLFNPLGRHQRGMALKDKPMSVQWILSLPPYREGWLHE